MNIFVLDRNPILAAMYQVDKHVVKMPLATWRFRNQPDWWK